MRNTIKKQMKNNNSNILHLRETLLETNPTSFSDVKYANFVACTLPRIGSFVK